MNQNEAFAGADFDGRYSAVLAANVAANVLYAAYGQWKECHEAP